MKIGYGNGKIIWGREYDCSDDVDMKILIENLKAEFSKIDEENILLKHKLATVNNILDDYYE